MFALAMIMMVAMMVSAVIAIHNEMNAERHRALSPAKTFSALRQSDVRR